MAQAARDSSHSREGMQAVVVGYNQDGALSNPARPLSEERNVPQLMRTSNPALNDQVFRGEGAALGEAMTVQGTVNKTGILLLCAVATAAWTWDIFLHSHSPESVAPLALIGVI